MGLVGRILSHASFFSTQTCIEEKIDIFFFLFELLYRWNELCFMVGQRIKDWKYVGEKPIINNDHLLVLNAEKI